MRLPGNGDLHLAVEHVHQRVKGSGVLSEPLPFGKRELSHRAAAGLDDGGADDRAFRIRNQPGRRKNLRLSELRTIGI